MQIDFGKTADDYRRHRAGFPDEFFWELQRYGIGLRKQRILDVGTGTGTVARGLATRGANVTAVDIAQALMDQAVVLDQQHGLDINYQIARAEDVPFADATFDVVTAGQCWHWFDRDRAAQEVLRVLRPGGKLVIAHFDWLPLRGNVVEATENLILAHNPRWHLSGGTGLHPEWCADVALAGFEDIRTMSFDTAVMYSHERWRGRIRASAGVAASLPAEEVERFDAEHAAMLDKDFPTDSLSIPHRVWFLVCRKPYGYGERS